MTAKVKHWMYLFSKIQWQQTLIYTLLNTCSSVCLWEKAFTFMEYTCEDWLHWREKVEERHLRTLTMEHWFDLCLTCGSHRTRTCRRWTVLIYQQFPLRLLFLPETAAKQQFLQVIHTLCLFHACKHLSV